MSKVYTLRFSEGGTDYGTDESWSTSHVVAVFSSMEKLLQYKKDHNLVDKDDYDPNWKDRHWEEYTAESCTLDPD